jgi:hypothetical protein
VATTGKSVRHPAQHRPVRQPDVVA